MERRLAAILAADIVGYSRLMEADEEATVCALKACRQITDALIADHGGRVFGSAGDSVIAEFPSPVEAVRCAVDIQREIEVHNADRPEDRHMRFRMGVNLGDVIVEGDNLLGGGVNIAARLESLADPGGVFISRPVLDQVRKKLGLGYEYLGKHEVKNIAEPVRVFRVLTDPESAGKLIGLTWQLWEREFLAAAVIAFIGLATAIVWLSPWKQGIEHASVERMAFPLPDRPSIAVLPFNNLSGDAGKGHIADGLTEDLITALSQVSSLFVIARNSTFVYKGKPVKVQQVAEDLGVRYVLEGSFRTSGERVRVTAQLIDALSGNHLWAERYDRDMTELFALQDEITDKIVIALQIKLTQGEEVQIHRKHTRSIAAWNLVGNAMQHFNRVNATDNIAARGWIKKAIEIDREYALAYALLAWTHWFDAQLGWGDNPEFSFNRAAYLADKAQALNDTLPDVYALQGAIHLYKRQYNEAVAAGKKAVDINPNHATNTALLAMILHNAGQPEEAIELFKTAMRLSPYYPAWFLEELGFSYLDAGQFDLALVAFNKFLDRKPDPSHGAHSHVGRALAYHFLGQENEARAEITKALEIDADISLANFRQQSLSRDSAKLEQGIAVLRQLGLPE